MLPKHVAGRKMRHAILPGQLFRLRAFPGARRPEENHRAVEVSHGTLFQRHACSPLTTAAQTSLWRKALVIAHDEVSLQLLHCIHRHAHTDQEGGAAKVEMHAKHIQDRLLKMTVNP